MKKIHKNKSGIAIILVILLMGVILSLASYYLSFSLTEKKISKSQAYGVKTYYLAEAGIQEMIWRLKNIEAYRINFENDPNWVQSFTTIDPFGPNSGSYTVTINNIEQARGEIVSTGMMEVEPGKFSQRIIKTNAYRALGDTSELADNCGYANGNINISNSKVNFYNGSAHSNNNFIIDGSDSLINIDSDLNAVNNYLPHWKSIVNVSGAVYAANMLNGPAVEINMPGVDFNSSDPDSLKNSADVVYTKKQFEDLLETTPVVLNNGITYVEGDVEINGGVDLTVNGLLVAERDFKIGAKKCQTKDICGEVTITVNHEVGKSSGLLAKRKIDFDSYSGNIDISGVVYGNDQISIKSLPKNRYFKITGGLLSRMLSISSVHYPLDIIRDEEIINTTLGFFKYSPIITVEHWEEEY